ncbi:MAG: hypothetical protein ABFD54_04450 [Armatimonadota bacterium]
MEKIMREVKESEFEVVAKISGDGCCLELAKIIESESIPIGTIIEIDSAGADCREYAQAVEIYKLTDDESIDALSNPEAFLKQSAKDMWGE